MATRKNSRPSSKHSHRSPDNNFLKLSGIAFELAAFNFVVIFGGYKLDDWMGLNGPWFLVSSVFIAVIGSIYHLLNRLK